MHIICFISARNDLTTQFQLTEAEEPLKFNLVSVQRAANKFIQFAWRSSAPTDLIASFLAVSYLFIFYILLCPFFFCLRTHADITSYGN